MNLMNLFDLSFVGRRDIEALEFNNQVYTFAEINSRSNKMARLLKSRGLEKGDRICVYLENSLTFIDLYLASVKLGLIFVPVNILYREREITHIYKDAEPKAFIALGEVPGVIHSWDVKEIEIEALAQPDEPILNLTNGDSPAAIVYTSGTTGTSKGAVLTHNNFIANAVNLVTCWKFTENDRLLLSLPLFHVHGLANGIHCWLISGCKMRLQERFEHAKAGEWFTTFKPTVFFGVPTVYVRLLDWSKELASEIGEQTRLFVSGSAPLPPQVFDEFKTKYRHTILERYGMTETLMNISNPYNGERRAGTIGFALPGISAKIINNNGEEVGVNEEGEVYIKGPNVFAGYWKRNEATKDAFVNGYFKTGDMGEISADGYITLKGRKSDLIISGGFNIYPREIEEFLLEQDSIEEVAVVGVPDEVRGELPVAYIVPKGNYDATIIEQKCRETFASFKIPKKFITTDKLPRTALGKVQKHLLPKP